MTVNPTRLFFGCLFLCIDSFGQSTFSYPPTKTVDVTDTYFGQTIKDPYRWLEDANSSDTKQWVEDQNDFSRKYLNKNAYSFENREGILKNEYYNISEKNNRNSFFYQYSGGLAPDLMYHKKIDGYAKAVVTPLKYGKYQRVRSFSLSKDSTHLAFMLSDAGSDWGEIRITDINTREEYDEVLKGVKSDKMTWRGNGFYYSRYPLPEESKMLTEKNINSKIYYHKLGDNQSNDQLIYYESNPNSIPYAAITSDERFLIIYGNEYKDGKWYSKLSYIDFKDTKFTAPRVFLMIPRAGFQVIDGVGDSLFLTSNYKAPAKRIFSCNPKKANKLHLIVPEFEEPLDHVSIMDNKLVCLYKQNANHVSIVYSLTGNILHRIDFPVACDVSGFGGASKDSITSYQLQSFTLPPIRYQYNLRTFKTELLSKIEIHYDPAKFVTKQEFYQSKDGTKIPIYIVYKKSVKLKGNNPCLIYGYGGFGISLDPFFDPGLIYFLEKGGVFAAPCIRGGGEYGQEWHNAGRLLKKQNSFDDFISAAEYMIAKQYTNSSKLAMMGGSNGGLVVGAVMTQRPELFKVAVPMVGAFEMLRYQHYTRGGAVASEYGLSSDSIQFNNLIKYSPLHNVKKASYPSTLITTGDHDDRVPPFHSYKFAATLQKMNTGPNPILLLVNENAGHNGSGTLNEKIFIYGFILHELGE